MGNIYDVYVNYSDDSCASVATGRIPCDFILWIVAKWLIGVAFVYLYLNKGINNFF